MVNQNRIFIIFSAFIGYSNYNKHFEKPHFVYVPLTTL